MNVYGDLVSKSVSKRNKPYSVNCHWGAMTMFDKDGLQARTELRQWQRWVMNGQWQQVP